MVKFHNFSLTELEEMLPWEFDVYLSLTSNYMEKLEMDRKQAALGGGQAV